MDIQLHVPQILQNPQLPNGCEITSCCEVLNFLGYPADKCDLADHYLPRSEVWYGTDPNLFYMGDPHRDDEDPRTGYYCFAGPVITAANRYMERNLEAYREKKHLEDENTASLPHRYTAVDITGAGEEILIGQLSLGRPFIFWASLHFQDIQFDTCEPYRLTNGKMHRVFHQLHCMVCDGADDEYFYVSDPLDFNRRVPREQFIKIYHQLGSRAVVFVPVGEPLFPPAGEAEEDRRLAGMGKADLEVTEQEMTGPEMTGQEMTVQEMVDQEMEEVEMAGPLGGIRAMGIRPGLMPPGPRNTICDVPGVKVGHWTLHNGKHHTGVTIILPRPDIYHHKCIAAAHVLNGYGKSAGLVQIQELGQLESPIALTNTLNVGLVSDALVQLAVEDMEQRGKRLRSFNPAVGECNDAMLNTIGERVVGYAQVCEAIRSASETFEQGCVGAGAGMTCHGLKGGIGSASRTFLAAGKTWTVGVLALCNHGELQELRIGGKLAGPEIARKIVAMQKKTRKENPEGEKPEDEKPEDEKNPCADLCEPDPDNGRESASGQGLQDEDRGSCMMILATDLPLSDRQLLRLIKRTGVGMARCGSFWGHGSGDIAIGFTTAGEILQGETRFLVPAQVVNEDRLNAAFAAAAEASEEAVLNALAYAETTAGPDGTVRHALREFIPFV